jgi:hypothetical protein
MDITAFLKDLWNPTTPLLLGVGAVATRLWQRYLARLAAFRWSAWHNRLAVAGHDPNVGKVEVLWNGNSVSNLQVCVVEFENESSRDFTDVEVKFSYADGTDFLGDGSVYGLTQFVPYAPRFGAQVQTLLDTPVEDRPVADLDFVRTNRQYTIPVLNRGTKFRLTFVVHPPTLEPVIHVSCDHKGVRLYQRSESRPTFLGVVQAHASLIGLAAGVFAVAALSYWIHRPWIVTSAAFLFGALAQLVGAGLVHLKRLIVRTVG